MENHRKIKTDSMYFCKIHTTSEITTETLPATREAPSECCVPVTPEPSSYPAVTLS